MTTADIGDNQKKAEQSLSRIKAELETMDFKLSDKEEQQLREELEQGGATICDEEAKEFAEGTKTRFEEQRKRDQSKEENEKEQEEGRSRLEEYMESRRRRP